MTVMMTKLTKTVVDQSSVGALFPSSDLGVWLHGSNTSEAKHRLVCIWLDTADNGYTRGLEPAVQQHSCTVGLYSSTAVELVAGTAGL